MENTLKKGVSVAGQKIVLFSVDGKVWSTDLSAAKSSVLF
jgi:hypothetical protein